MSKELLEALEKLLSFAFVMSENMVGLTKGNYDEATFVKKTYEYLHKYNVDLNSKLDLKEALRRLEAIDNSKPSEALKCLEYLDETCGCFALDNEYKAVDTIKQALLKAQEQEKVLKTIFEKRIDMWHLVGLLDQDYEMYIAFCKSEKYKEDYILTEEEFDLLKSLLEE